MTGQPLQNLTTKDMLNINYRHPPRVSVIIPAYNAEKWVKECITSVLIQDYPLHEIIVVNDASTDKTGEIVKELADFHKCIKIITHERNEGECVASYNGFEYATGEFLCRLSADDSFVQYNHISTQITYMTETGADWCYNPSNFTGRIKKYDGIDTIRSYWLPVPLKYSHGSYQVFDNLILANTNLALAIIMVRNPVNSSTLMWRANAYKQVKWCRKYRTDCDGMILMRMLMKGLRGITVPGIGVFYRLHDEQGSHSPQYRADMAESRKEVARAIQNGNYPFWLRKFTERFL